MPVFIGLIIEIVVGFAARLVAIFSQKIAFAISIIVFITGLMGALFVALRAALQMGTSLAASVHPMFGAGVQMVISSRVSSLLVAYLGLWVAVELYKWKMNLVQVWAKTI